MCCSRRCCTGACLKGSLCRMWPIRHSRRSCRHRSGSSSQTDMSHQCSWYRKCWMMRCTRIPRCRMCTSCHWSRRRWNRATCMADRCCWLSRRTWRCWCMLLRRPSRRGRCPSCRTCRTRPTPSMSCSWRSRPCRLWSRKRTSQRDTTSSRFPGRGSFRSRTTCMWSPIPSSLRTTTSTSSTPGRRCSSQQGRTTGTVSRRGTCWCLRYRTDTSTSS